MKNPIKIPRPHCTIHATIAWFHDFMHPNLFVGKPCSFHKFLPFYLLFVKTSFFFSIFVWSAIFMLFLQRSYMFFCTFSFMFHSCWFSSFILSYFLLFLTLPVLYFFHFNPLSPFTPIYWWYLYFPQHQNTGKPQIRTLYCWVLRYQVPFLKPLVWRSLGLNPGLLDHWRTLNPLGQWAGYKLLFH